MPEVPAVDMFDTSTNKEIHIEIVLDDRDSSQVQRTPPMTEFIAFVGLHEDLKGMYFLG